MYQSGIKVYANHVYAMNTQTIMCLSVSNSCGCVSSINVGFDCDIKAFEMLGMV